MSSSERWDAVSTLRAHGFQADIVQSVIKGSFPSADDELMRLPDGREVVVRKSSFSILLRDDLWELSVTKNRSGLLPETRHEKISGAVDRLLSLFP